MAGRTWPRGRDPRSVLPRRQVAAHRALRDRTQQLHPRRSAHPRRLAQHRRAVRCRWLQRLGHHLLRRCRQAPCRACPGRDAIHPTRAFLIRPGVVRSTPMPAFPCPLCAATRAGKASGLSGSHLPMTGIHHHASSTRSGHLRLGRTTVDFGSFAPTRIFVDAFKQAFDFDLSLAEARGPMGPASGSISRRSVRTPSSAHVGGPASRPPDEP